MAASVPRPICKNPRAFRAALRAPSWSRTPPSSRARCRRSTVEGRAALTHALAHIELNAIDLALDICWRFAGMPHDFYRKWLVVAKKETLHFELLRDHLHALGHAYGDFPAHRALWEMAEKTKHDPLTSRRRSG